ncbi:Mis6 domain protein [Aspergillus saccharolyticus JOP 1030-1]|uniref:Mis6 domain protein n=1 Tax=Aspergillus saccharolyticus JOP 1030-1 TaxID=1450539 RepID=A0A319A920_9EURO|nr:Mis6 domain protein [Aspergillus saccharolyticus JOP 1030-1]PYH48188.1 Mis6 domain protein [Aspergillus saccharolyticus JOP 1030-1]
MSSDSDRGSDAAPTSLQDAIQHLEAVSFLPSKQRYTDAGQLARTIATHAYESGIPQSGLEHLLQVLTKSNQLDQGTITILVKNLYPQERISSKTVTQVVCCLGPAKTKPSPATQALLLRWLILVYDFLDDRSHLAKLYAVLFNHLDMLSLRKPLCHLLSLITRRKHVKPFRIQALMELLGAAGCDDKELLTLLKAFKNYCPDVIVGDLGSSGRKALFFKHPDLEWTAHVRQIQETHSERLQAAQPSTFQVVHRGMVKRGKMEVIVPAVQTSRVSLYHTALEELRSVDHFVERLDRIEIPNQIISMMGDPLAQKYLFLTQSDAAHRRLNDWLKSFLDDQLEHMHENDHEGTESLGYIMDLALNYAQYTKEIPHPLVPFLKQYILSWDGYDNQDRVLLLLSYLPLQEFKDLREEFLGHLEVSILDGTPRSQVTLLDFYSSLIHQWGVRLRSQPLSAREFKPLGRLISHAELLALSSLESTIQRTAEVEPEGQKPATLSVLEFYCTLAELFSHAPLNRSIRLTIPLAPTVYTLVFTPISSVMSIMSSVLATYKSSFEASLTSPALQIPHATESLYPTDLVGQFNGYIMDICNLIWRNRGLNSDDPNALGCLIPAPIVNALTRFIRNLNDSSRERKRDVNFFYTISSVFSLSHHVALCNMSAACFADIEENNGIDESQPRLQKPVTQKALSALEKEGGLKLTWQEYRVRMLDWLDATGNVGIGNLMRSTMKALRKE